MPPVTEHPPAGPTRFGAVRLRIDGRSPQLQRLDAQAAVDVARQQSNAARHALLAATASVALDNGRAQLAADDATAVLRAAVAVLTACDTAAADREVPTATIEVDVLTGARGGMTVVRPHGEIDMVTSPALERACVGQLDGPGAARLIVDLSAVTFLDSSGLAVLVEVERVCGECGTAFAVSGANPRTRRLLAITRLDTVFEVE